MSVLGIIGGTGLSQIDGFEVADARSVETPYGDPSHTLEIGAVAGRRFIFLARHGNPGHIPPHLVNYRANLWALKQLGADEIIAVNSVGAIDTSLAVKEVVICDQIIDYTHGRAHTYFEDRIHHVEFAHPYDAALCGRLQRSAVMLRERDGAFRYRVGGVYGCTQGPRLETAAEIERMQRDGCHVVGMTAMPEAALAAELSIPYASLSLVINPAARLDSDPIDFENLERVIEEGMVWIKELLALCLSPEG